MKSNLAPQYLPRCRSIFNLLAPHLLFSARLIGVYLIGRGECSAQGGHLSSYKRSWSPNSPWPLAVGHPSLHEWPSHPHATRNPASSLHLSAVRNKNQFVKKTDASLSMTKMAPIAMRKEHKTDDGRVDYYHWLRDPNWPNVTDSEVLNYLNQENDYTEANIPKDLIDKLFNEMKDRVEKSDKTVPYLDNGYYYYSFIHEEQQYWTHARREVNSNKEEILIDENLLAADKKHLSVSCVKVSPDNKAVAYTADFSGDERYVVYVKDIASGEIIENNIDDVYGRVVWDKFGKGFFYTPAGEFWRPDKIFYHEIGKSKEEDKLLFHEEDVTFSLSVRKSKSQDYIYFLSSSSTSSEFRFIPSDMPFQTPEIIYERSNNHLYDVVHHQDRFFLHINDVSPNYRVVEMPIDGIKDKILKEFIPASPDKYIQDIYAYENHLVLLNRVDGLTKAEIINLNDNGTQKIDIDDESYEISIIQNTFKDSALRYSYSSLKTPKTIIDHDFVTGEKLILKTQKIPSGFDSSKYVLKRIWAKTDDEVNVPISLIYNKEKAKLDGSDPLYLYGYGSYGYSVPDNFRPQIFSLVDRGYTYALAHIRGGDELGKAWHETAKFLTKKKTFIDFIKSAEKLIEDKYTSEGKIVIKGVSAGGMLIGACINMRPELYKTAVAVVPFVDVLNTMFDDTLPLTPGEFKEWGNPKEEDYYTYIKSYSPYDNIVPQKYPNIFVTAGLSDPRVTYWESAKWVALLRHTKTDDNLLLLKTDMSSGHGGPTGRFEYLKELATEFAFILTQD